MEKLKVSLIIPSLDPDEKLLHTVEDAINAGFDDIIVIDDGSSPEHKHNFPDTEKYPQVTLLTHEINKGKGAALKTAFEYFLANRTGYDGVVTADGDGQHGTNDILACARELLSDEPAVILGCRDFSLDNVPKRSRFGNGATSFVFRIFCGMKISDTQTGLRAIPTCYVKPLMAAKGTRYEYETNMLLLMNTLAIPYREVKIETIYHDENKASHFRPVRDSIRVYGLILKYAASSLSTSILDLLLFYLFGLILFPGGSKFDVFMCTAIARVISSIANFILNKRLVFEDNGRAGKTVFRYTCLAVPILLASWLLVYTLSDVCGIESELVRTCIKIPVDVALFLVSFRVQRQWVFDTKRKRKPVR